MTLLTEPFRARTWRKTAYAVCALPVGAFWFALLVACYGTGLGSLVGVPLIAVGLVLARVGARWERRFLGWATGEAVAAPPEPRIPPDATFWQRWKPVLLDMDRLRETAYLLLLLPAGVVLFTVAVTVWTVGLAGLTAPLWAWAVTDPDPLWERLAVSVVGLAVALAAPWIVRGLVHVQSKLAHGLLGASRRKLEEERDAAVQTVSRDRRQLERDLHDGAQARLVGLAVDLGRARERLEEGAAPEEALELVRDAHEDAKRALEEVRDLARGIHPAILTDRGLDAALSALAAKSPVPVYLDSDPAARATEAVEAAAYFVVSEALANIGKHSGATQAEVRVVHEDGSLVVRVEDDGVGGAAPVNGSGLTGLADRVRSLGGTFDLVSPLGRGTTLIARFPCG